MKVLQAVALACLLAALQAAPAAAAVPNGCPTNAPVVTESAEQLQQAVERVTTFPTTLDPRIFDNATEVLDGQMHPDVREAAIALVERNVAAMDLPPEFTIDAIELQGSAASYEWDELADLGIHVFLAVNGSVCPTSCKAPEGPVCEAACQYDTISKLYNSYIEGEQEATFTDSQGRTTPKPDPDTGVLLNGLVAEVTILPTKPPNQMPVNGTGLYSFTTDSWVMEPTQQPDNWDRAEILGNVTQFVDEYNALLCEYEAAKAAVLPDAPGALDFNCSRWDAFAKKLKKFRGSGFDANLGSRSTSNLAYRLLRRISVNVVDQPGAWEQQCINLKASLPALPGISENIDGETRSELPGYLTLTAFAAQELAKRGQLGFQLTGPLIFKALAWYTLASALLAALDVQQGPALQDRVGGFVGPAFLAVNFLGGLGGLLSPFEAAAAGFGVLLTDALPAFAYSRWVWLATLGAAIYSGLSAQWLVAAFGVGSLWKLLNQLQGGGAVRPQNAAFAALAAWAFYAKQTPLVALAVMAGHMAAEVVS